GFPRERWRSVALSPPPGATCAVRSRSSATSPSINSCLRANSSDSRATCEERTAIVVSLPRGLHYAAMGEVTISTRSRRRRVGILSVSSIAEGGGRVNPTLGGGARAYLECVCAAAVL